MLYRYNMSIIKEIRLKLNYSQQQLADEIGVSFATVNRWENDKAEPTKLAQEKLLEICNQNKIDITEITLNNIKKESENIQKNDKNKVILYHGSKSGLKGRIKPSSREECDFGRGFYMGSDPVQPLTLIASYEESKFYILSLQIKGLKKKEIPQDIDWAMLVAYHRGRMKPIEGTKFYQKYEKMDGNCDLVIGKIADDRMFYVLDSFFRGFVTDIGLVNSLSALNLGVQYVAKNDKCCANIKIEKEIPLLWIEKRAFYTVSAENRRKGISLANQICKDARREGEFFDEILEGAK